MTKLFSRVLFHVSSWFARQKPALAAAVCAAAALCLGIAPSAYGQVQVVPSIITLAGNGTAGYTGDGGPATSAELDNPYGVAVDHGGNIYIADSHNNVVREVVAATGIIKTIAGNGTRGYSGDGGPATGAELNSPSGVAVDSAGDVYIADTSNERIREVVATTGIIKTIAGTGAVGYSGDGGPATSAELADPDGLALDSAGNVYSVDMGDSVIRKIVAATGIIETIAGTGAVGYSGDGGPATSAELDAPFGVAVDSAGNIYIADTGNNVLREVSAATGIIETIAGNGTYGYSGDGGPATSAELDVPFGVAVDSAGNIYIADSNNHVIREIAGATGTIETTAGNGTYGYSGNGGPATSAELDVPCGVAVDSAGNVYIADLFNSNRIREVSTFTNFPGTEVGAASETQNVNIELVSAQAVNSIAAAASQGNKQEYVLGTISGCTVDGTTVNSAGTFCTVPITFKPAYPGERGVPLTVEAGSGTYQAGLTGVGTGPLAALTPGIISTFAGNGTRGYSGDGGPATGAELNSSSGVAVDSTGNIYIADTDNNRIREVVAATGIIKTIAGNGTRGYSGDGGPATSAELDLPFGVAVDSAGNIYIADNNNQVIREIAGATGIIKTIAGNGTGGYSGDGGPATSAELAGPEGVAVDSAGNVYIAEFGDSRIREVVAATGTIKTIAGNGTGGYSGDGGPATSAELDLPFGVAVDSAGNIYIADTYNSRIREVVAATGTIKTIAGDGTKGYSGDGGAATSAELTEPNGVAVDSAGNVYIAEYGDSRIREVEAATGTIETIAGDGTNGYSGDGGPATSAELFGPGGAAVDSAGNVYIADLGNMRIREVNAGRSILSFTSTVANSGNSSDSPQTVQVQNVGNSTLAFPLPTTGTNPSVSANFAWDNASTCDQTDTKLSTAYTLASGASCNIAIDFAPTTTGSISGSVVLTDDALNTRAPNYATQTISLSGTGTAPALSIAATSLPGGTVGTAYSGALQANGGVAPYTWSIASGSLPAGLSLNAGTGAITGTPTTAGTASFAVEVKDSESTPETATASLSISVAAVLAPLAMLSPSSLTFASQTVGSTSTAQTVTLTNSGTAALTISSISASGDFAETQKCGTSVAPGANCPISVTFTPTASGSRSGTLTIADNASGSPQTVALSGTGSSVSITPPSGSSGLSVSSPGGTTTAVLQVGSVGSFSGTVNLTCAVAYTGTGTPNDPPTCSLNPTQETIAAGGSGNVTLTVNTTAATSAMLLRGLSGGTALASLAILFFVPRRRRRGLMMLLVLGFLSAMACSACGGGGAGNMGSSGSSGGTQNSGTTAGSYKVTVTATSGSDTATATIPLTVQ